MGLPYNIQGCLPIKRRQDLVNEDVEIVWLELEQNGHSTYIGVCDQPPTQRREKRDDSMQVISDTFLDLASISHDSINSELRNYLFYLDSD
jgi:hypothetical protein